MILWEVAVSKSPPRGVLDAGVVGHGGGFGAAGDLDALGGGHAG